MGNQHATSRRRPSSSSQRSASGRGPSSDRPPHDLGLAAHHRSPPPSATTRQGRSVSSASPTRSPRRTTATDTPSVAPTFHVSETASGATAATTLTAAPPGRLSSHAPSVSSLTTAAAAGGRQPASPLLERQALHNNEAEDGNDEGSLNADRSARSTSCAPSLMRMPNPTFMSADEAASGLTSEAGTPSIPLGSNAAVHHTFNAVPTTVTAVQRKATATTPRAARATEGQHAASSSSSLGAGTATPPSPSGQGRRHVTPSSTQPPEQPQQQPVEESLFPLIVRSSRQGSISAARINVEEERGEGLRPHSPSPEAQPPTQPLKDVKKINKKVKSRKGRRDGDGLMDDGGGSAAAAPRSPSLKSPSRSGGMMAGLFNPRSDKFLFRKSSLSSSPRAAAAATTTRVAEDESRTSADAPSSFVRFPDDRPTLTKAASVPSRNERAEASLHTSVVDSLEEQRERSSCAEQQRRVLDEDEGRARGGEAVHAAAAATSSSSLSSKKSTSAHPQHPSCASTVMVQDGASAETTVTARVISLPSERCTQTDNTQTHSTTTGTTNTTTTMGGPVVSLLLPAERGAGRSRDASPLTAAGAERPSSQRAGGRRTTALPAPSQAADGAEATLSLHSPCKCSADRRSPSSSRDSASDEATEPTGSKSICGAAEEDGTAPTEEATHQASAAPLHERGDRFELDDEDTHSTTSTDTNSAPILPPPPTASFEESMWGIKAAASSAVNHGSRRDADAPVGQGAGGAAALSTSGSSAGANSSPMYSPRMFLSRSGRGGALSGATTVTDTTARVSPRSPYASPPLALSAIGVGADGRSPAHLSSRDLEARMKARKSVSQSAIIAAWNRMGARSGSLPASPGSPVGGVKASNNGGGLEEAPDASAEVDPPETVVAGGGNAHGTLPQAHPLTSSPSSSPPAAAPRPPPPPPPPSPLSVQQLESAEGITYSPLAHSGTTRAGKDNPKAKTNTADTHVVAVVVPVRRRSVLTRQRGHPTMFSPPPPPPPPPSSSSPLWSSKVESAEEANVRSSPDAADTHASPPPPPPITTVAVMTAVAADGRRVSAEASSLAHSSNASPLLTEEAAEDAKPRSARERADDTLRAEELPMPYMKTYTLPTFFTLGDTAEEDEVHRVVVEARRCSSSLQTGTDDRIKGATADEGDHDGDDEDYFVVGFHALSGQHTTPRALSSRAFAIPSTRVESDATTHSHLLSGAADFADGSETSTSATIHIQRATEGEAEDLDDMPLPVTPGTSERLREADACLSPCRSPHESKQPQRRPTPKNGFTTTHTTRAASVTATTLTPLAVQARRSLSDMSSLADEAAQFPLHRPRSTSAGLVRSNPSSPARHVTLTLRSRSHHRYVDRRNTSHDDGVKESGEVGAFDANDRKHRDHDVRGCEVMEIERGGELENSSGDAAAAAVLAEASSLLHLKSLPTTTANGEKNTSHVDSSSSANANTHYPYRRLVSPPTLAGASHNDSNGSVGSATTAAVTTDAAAAAVQSSGSSQPSPQARVQQQQQQSPQQTQHHVASSVSSARLVPFWRERSTPNQAQPLSSRLSSTTREEVGLNHSGSTTNNSNGGEESGDSASPAGSRRRRFSTASQGPPPLAQQLQRPPQQQQQQQQLHRRELSGSGVQWKEVSLLSSAAGTPSGTAIGVNGIQDDEELRHLCHADPTAFGTKQVEEEEEEEEEDEERFDRVGGDEDRITGVMGRMQHRGGQPHRTAVVGGGGGGGGAASPSWSSGVQSPMMWGIESPRRWRHGDVEEGEEEEDEEGAAERSYIDDDEDGDGSYGARRTHLHDRKPRKQVFHTHIGGDVRRMRQGDHGHFYALSPRGVFCCPHESPPQDSSLPCTPPEKHREDENVRLLLGSSSDGAAAAAAAAEAHLLPSSASDQEIPHPRTCTTSFAEKAPRMPFTRYEPPMPSNKNTFTAFLPLADITSSHLLASATALFQGGYREGDSAGSSSKLASGAATNGSGEAVVNAVSSGDTPVTEDTLLLTGNSFPAAQKSSRGRPGGVGGGGGAALAMSGGQLNSPLFSSVSTAPTNRISSGYSPVQGSLALLTAPAAPQLDEPAAELREQCVPDFLLACISEERSVTRSQQALSGGPGRGRHAQLALPEKRRPRTSAPTAAAAPTAVAFSQRNLPHQAPLLLSGVCQTTEQTAPIPCVVAEHLNTQHKQQPSLLRATEPGVHGIIEYVSPVEPAALHPAKLSRDLLHTPPTTEKRIATTAFAAAAVDTATLVTPTSATTTATTTTTATQETAIASSESAHTSAPANRSRSSSGLPRSSGKTEPTSGESGVGLYGERQDTWQLGGGGGGSSDAGIRRHASARALTSQPLSFLPSAMVRTNSEPIISFQPHRGSILSASPAKELPWWNRTRLARSEGSRPMADESTRGETSNDSEDGSHVADGASKSACSHHSDDDDDSNGEDEIQHGQRDASMGSPLRSQTTAIQHLTSGEAEDAEGETCEECKHNVSGIESKPIGIQLVLSFNFDEEHVNHQEARRGEEKEEKEDSDEEEGRLIHAGERTATWRTRRSPLSQSFPPEAEPNLAHSIEGEMPVTEKLTLAGNVVPPTSSFLAETYLDDDEYDDDARSEEDEDAVGAIKESSDFHVSGNPRSRSGSQSSNVAAFNIGLKTLVEAEAYTRACIETSAQDVLETWTSVWSALQQAPSMASPSSFYSTLAPLHSTGADGATIEDDEDGGEAEEVADAQLATSPLSPTPSDTLARLASAPHSPFNSVPPLSVPMLLSLVSAVEKAVAKGTTASANINDVAATPMADATNTTSNTGDADAGESRDVAPGEGDGHLFSAAAPLGDGPARAAAESHSRGARRWLVSPLEATTVAEAACVSVATTVQEEEEGEEGLQMNSSPLHSPRAAEGASWNTCTVATAHTPNAANAADHEMPSYFLYGPSTTSAGTVNNTLSMHTEEGEEEHAERWTGPSQEERDTTQDDTSSTRAHVGAPSSSRASAALTQGRPRSSDETTCTPSTSSPTHADTSGASKEAGRPEPGVARRTLPPPPPPSPPTPPSPRLSTLQNARMATDESSGCPVKPNERRSSPDPSPPSPLVEKMSNNTVNGAHARATVVASARASAAGEGGQGSSSGFLDLTRRASSSWSPSPSPRSPQVSLGALLSPAATGASNTRAHTAQRRQSVGQVVCRWCGATYTSAEVCPVAQRTHHLLREERKREKIAKREAQVLLCEGRVAEAVALLQQVGLYVP